MNPKAKRAASNRPIERRELPLLDGHDCCDVPQPVVESPPDVGLARHVRMHTPLAARARPPQLAGSGPDGPVLVHRQPLPLRECTAARAQPVEQVRSVERGRTAAGDEEEWKEKEARGSHRYCQRERASNALDPIAPEPTGYETRRPPVAGRPPAPAGPPTGCGGEFADQNTTNSAAAVAARPPGEPGSCTNHCA